MVCSSNKFRIEFEFSLKCYILRFFPQNDQYIDEELDKAFRALLTNEVLFITWPGLRTRLQRCQVLKNDVKFMETCTGALAVKDSLIASVDFLKQVRMKVRI